MFLPMIIAGTVSLLFVDQVLQKPRRKSAEEEFGESMAKYFQYLQEKKNKGNKTEEEEYPTQEGR